MDFIKTLRSGFEHWDAEHWAFALALLMAILYILEKSLHILSGLWRFILRRLNGPPLSLSMSWKHIQASANHGQAKEWDQSNSEFYVGEFDLKNTGDRSVYLGKVTISDKEGEGCFIPFSEMVRNGNTGYTEKAINFPEPLQPGQAFTFTHDFSASQFQKMNERQHFLFLVSARTFQLKITTNI